MHWHRRIYFIKEADGGQIMMKAQQSEKLQKFRYFYQYPYFRLFIAYFVTICNFWIFAEDPVAHSHSPCEIPLVGNAFSFVFTKYPDNGFSALKFLLWFIALIAGLLAGKLILHRILFKRVFKLSMFSNDQGSWMLCFLTTIILLMIFSFVYNGFLSLDSDMDKYKITGYIGAKNHTFMRAAALGTWFGDFLTAWMVTDMMLQDNKKYPTWAVSFRSWWKRGLKRVYFFWGFSIVLTTVVIVAVCTDFINWDDFNRNVVYTNELGRAFLASFILCMDLTIVMQDWDFPLFQTNLDVKLPGLNTGNIKFNIPDCLRREHWTIHVTGKWFNYGVLFIVMILDLNMWKNQIFYNPLDYGQYTGEDGHIYSVLDPFSLSFYKNETVFSYAWRNVTINPLNNQTYISGDYRTNSRFRGYSLALRGMAFIPSIVTFIVFGFLIYIFGREGTAQYETANFEDKAVALTNIRVTHSSNQNGILNEGDEKLNEGDERTERKSPERQSPSKSPNYGATSSREERTNTITPVD